MSFGLEIVTFYRKIGKLLGLGSFWWLCRLWKEEQEYEVGFQTRANLGLTHYSSTHCPSPLVTQNGSHPKWLIPISSEPAPL